MQVEELVRFLDWLDEEVRKPDLVNLYQQLHKILNSNAQPNQEQQPIESQKDALIEAVLKVRLNALNYAQTRFAEHIGLLDLVGQRAKEAIEEVLYKNVIDIATSAQKIKKFQDSLSNLLGKMTQVSTGLSPYVEGAPPEYDEALIHIRFQHDASINNIVDLKKWGNAWYEIGRGIALINQLPPEDIKIIGASRGSIVYDLVVVYAVANTLTGIILLVLKVADRVLDIRMKAEELRKMKLSSDNVVQELKKEAKKVKEDGQANVLEKIKADKQLDGEQENALRNAIGKIFDFISNGGEVDVHIKEEEVEEAQQGKSKNKRVIAEINKSFKEIKRLEEKSRLLKDTNP